MARKAQRSLFLTSVVVLLFSAAVVVSARPLDGSGFTNEGYWDPLLKSCYGQPRASADGNPIYDGCMSEGTVSMLTTCDRNGGLLYRLFSTTANCSGPEMSSWQAIGRCFNGANGPAALLCPNDNDWSKIQQIVQPPIAANGNVTGASGCGGSTGIKCTGPRTLTWGTDHCEGTPQSTVLMYGGMVAETCYRYHDIDRPDAIGYNVRTSCDSMAGIMRINTYNSGCNGTPVSYKEVPFGKCLSYAPGTGSYMFLCY